MVACEGMGMTGDGPGYVGGDVVEEGFVVEFFEGGEDPFHCFKGKHCQYGRCG